MIIKKIVYIGFLTAFLFAIKFAFGFVAGVEFVTTIILLYALFLPFYWTSLITVCFILITGIFYGFGAWWLIYWLIWPTEVGLTFLFKRVLAKNNLIFAFWAAFWAFSIIFWYAISDFFIGGSSLVISNFLSGLIVNTIESASNFISAIILFYPVKNLFSKVFNYQQKRKEKYYEMN